MDKYIHTYLYILLLFTPIFTRSSAGSEVSSSQHFNGILPFLNLCFFKYIYKFEYYLQTTTFTYT